MSNTKSNPADTLASRQALDLLERMKLGTETILDDLDGIFMVIEEDGKILRGNRNLASIFGHGYEELLGAQLSRLFTTGTWNSFLRALRTISGGSLEVAELSLPIDGLATEAMPYHWRISHFGKTGQYELGPYFCVTGRDTSSSRPGSNSLRELKAAILMLRQDGALRSGFTEATDSLFKNPTLSELLDPASAQILLHALNGAPEGLTLQAARLPSLIRHGQRNLKISYQPIVQSGRIDSILLIIEL